MEESILLEILKEMQKKYQCMAEIERITREVGEFLSRNDQTSVQMLLGMRQEEMDKADMFTKNINCLISVLPPEEAAKVDNWVKGQENWNPNEQISEKIMEKGKNIQHILKRTIEIDRHISTRIAGTHSFYN
ncbi:hypothetical protein DS742_03805 [Lacrimispora amygdalina]|uniref:Flagellar protein FlgN n=1 Tax=Lacrimispora amygdalina TaxID=253257 RepID=A0A3E2NH98_9FIRM|nr:hypothetical protein [Clostridium indicum]RFZ80384.1 hypothetical protein DS742_03805 [Clostridium indicum]